jgi:hypothetical protein
VSINVVTPNVNLPLQTVVSGRISGIVQAAGTPVIPEFSTEFYMLAIFIIASAALTFKKLRSAQLKTANHFEKPTASANYLTSFSSILSFINSVKLL